MRSYRDVQNNCDENRQLFYVVGTNANRLSALLEAGRELSRLTSVLDFSAYFGKLMRDPS